MRRVISQSEAQTYINLGKTVEVFLGRINEDKEIISYLIIEKNKSEQIELSFIEHYDEGNLEYLDIYSFPFVDPDMNFETRYFTNFEDLVSHIKNRFGINEINFVNQGVIQDLYEDLLKSEGRD